MRKNFYPQTKRRSRGTFSRLVWGIFIVVIVLVLILLIAPQNLQGTFQRLTYPLWSQENRLSASVGTFFASLKGNNRLAQENQKLRLEINRLETLDLENRLLRDENQELRALLGRAQFASLVLTPVLRTPPGTFYDTLLVDIGTDTAIAEGNRVVAYGNIVIGEVSTIEGRVGTVRLYSTPGLETEVFVGTSTARVIARGRGAGNYIAEVPRDIDVSAGDIISLPSSPTLLFAEVETIESNPADPFQSVFFQSPVNINRLQFVEVVTDNEEIPKRLSPETPLIEGDILEDTGTSSLEIDIDTSL